MSRYIGDKPPETLEQMWDKILYGIAKVLENDKSQPTFEQLYRSVYNYCLYGAYYDPNAKSNLYFWLRDCLTSHLNGSYEHKRAEIEEDVLTFYNTEWNRYKLSATSVSDVFLYFNRAWVLPQISAGRSDVFEPYHLCLVVWKNVMFHKLQEKILESITNKLLQHPSPEDSDLILKTIQAYVDLGLADLHPHAGSPKPQDDRGCLIPQPKTQIFNIFTKYFENPILIKIEQRFATKAREFLESHSFMEYLEHVQMWYEDTIPDILSEFETRIKSAIDKGLTSVHGQLIPDLCNLLLDCPENPAMRLLVRLASSSDYSRQVLMQHLVNYLECSGRKAIEKIGINESCPIAFVTTVMDWRSRFFSIPTKTFHEIQGLEAAIHEACATLMRKYPRKISTAQLLVWYFDKSFRKFVNVEAHISNAMTLLKYMYVADQDAFLHFYTASFASRQLDQGTVNEEAELLMLAELKLAFGPTSTYKLQKMLDDLRVSKQENHDFKSCVQANQVSLQLDFDIRILSDGIWPIQRSTVQLPEVLLKWAEGFERYYCSKHNSRKLSWVHSHSKGVLKITWSNTKYCDFYVSLPQMVLLLVFQESDLLTVRDLQEKTKLESPRLKQALRGLLRTKVLICRTSTDDTDLQDESEIQFNQSYNAEKKHVVVKTHKSDLRREHQVDSDQIESEHLYMFLCQAAIVRFMKVQKVCQQEVLLEKVKVALKPRFAAVDSMLKKCILILVEKEYLQECSSNTYAYLP